jgi:cation transport protein ChaC
MPSRLRQMRLTQELVSQVPPFAGGADPTARKLVPPSDAEYAALVREILASAPSVSDIWIFGYGSLIWNPACTTVEEMIGSAPGWHRSFCLGWTTVFRGSKDRPGLMMALDRGGECKGVAYRLPEDAVEACLGKLVRREILGVPHVLVPRWLNVHSDAGVRRALAFVIDRKCGMYVAGLPVGQIADAIATAAGERGTTAEYLCSTVKHLEDRGIHDRHLWHLQELVAQRIESAVAATAGTPRQ